MNKVAEVQPRSRLRQSSLAAKGGQLRKSFPPSLYILHRKASHVVTRDGSLTPTWLPLPQVASPRPSTSGRRMAAPKPNKAEGRVLLPSSVVPIKYDLSLEVDLER